MGKNLKFILALSFLLLFAFTSDASNDSIQLEAASNLCDAPPPEDFRVTEIGPDFISLAWDPTWIGATYTLTIQSNSNSNGIEVWTTPDTFRNISGTSFTLTNRPMGFAYRIKISTNCAFDTPSTQVDSINQKTVLELITPGRTPFNPTVVDCENIEYNNGVNKWVGFRVTYNNEGFITSNLFEFAIVYDKKVNNEYYTTVQIKRVKVSNVIVAANSQPKWPTISEPLVQSNNPFSMYRLIQGQPPELIGNIFISGQMNYSPSISICIDPTPQWDFDHYSFETLVATSTMIQSQGFSHPTEIISNTINPDNSVSNTINVTNPISDNLKFSFKNSSYKNNKISLKVFNILGQLILTKDFDASVNVQDFEIPVENLDSGMYILKFEGDGKPCTFKVIKEK